LPRQNGGDSVFAKKQAPATSFFSGPFVFPGEESSLIIMIPWEQQGVKKHNAHPAGAFIFF
jgi:hypothetical protein